ncbi:MAG: cob(I)yrinic acid a,c-diamide adenosyltransferase, partial [Chloroflexota bacterium]|nr:cob(I)yrinic acid a,c-diamide adenosyltransferase [Chloroflexota bacterium]
MSREDSDRKRARHKGLVIVYTGKGKGKTTAALGMLLRAWGHGMRPCMIQFIKSEKGRWGEVKAAERLGLEWHTLGKGFTWESEDIEEDIR